MTASCGSHPACRSLAGWSPSDLSAPPWECALSFLAGGGGKPTSPLSTWAADRGVATEVAVSDVMGLVGLAGADDGAEASVIPPSPILGIFSGVCVETSDVGVRPYRQVVGVHGQHYLSLHCCVHVVDHDVEQQGGDHRSLRNAHTYSFGGRRGSLPPDLHRSVAQEGSDVVVHVASFCSSLACQTWS